MAEISGGAYCLPLGYLPNESLIVLREGDHRGGCPPALGVGDDDGIATFHDRYDGIGRPEVNANDLLSHTFSSCRGFDAGPMLRVAEGKHRAQLKCQYDRL